MIKNNIQIVEHFKRVEWADFSECTSEIRKAKDKFDNLSLNTNKITSSVEELTESQLRFIIEQYSCFSKSAIHMLLDAGLRNFDWIDLFKEIQNNIKEEQGLETKGIPHLEIMRKGYEKDLNILTDEVKTHLVTKSFLNKMFKIFNNNDNAYSAGALFAFEGVAIQEFHIIDKIIKQYDIVSGHQKVQNNDTLTNAYINGHKDFEIGHEAHLLDSITPYINDDNIKNFIIGYFDVCLTMDIWWEQIFAESYSVVFAEKNKFQVKEADFTL